MIYLDNSATTKIYDEALAEYNRINECMYFNPASLHIGGFNAEKEVENARKKIAQALKADLSEVYFTSGGTESDNLAIIGTALSRKRNGKHIITSKTEHHAVLNTCKFLEDMGFKITYVDVDSNGRISPDEIKSYITGETILVSVMAVNNETGTIQPISEIKKAIGDITLHTDAVQAFGKLKLSELNADLISLSAHKIHGPKGVGALYVKKGTKLSPFSFGGNQEKGLRSGTLNTPGICAFGVASEITLNNFNINKKNTEYLQDRLESTLQKSLDNICINGDDTKNGIVNVSFGGIRGEVLLHSLAEKDIYISTGSACNSKSTKVSYVLDAMGVKREFAEGAVRISIGTMNTVEEIDYACSEIINAVNFLRKFKRR